MMARIAASLPSRLSSRAAAATPARILSMSSGTPMTPVEATST